MISIVWICQAASTQRPRRRELGAFDAEERFHIAHIGGLGEQALAQGQIAGHVGGLHHQHKIGAGRDAPALLHGVFGVQALFKGIQMLFALLVEGDFDQGAQGVTERCAQFVGVQNGDLTLDPALVMQAFDAPQTSGRRYLDFLGQGHIAQAGVELEPLEQLHINAV